MILLMTTIYILFGCIIIPCSVVVANDYYELYGDFDQPRCLNVSKQLYCRRFDSWLQATALLENTPHFHDFASINLKPNNPLLLTSDLNITKAIANQTNQTFGIHIYGLKGIDLIGWSKNKKLVSLFIYASTLKFHINNLALGDYQCTEQLNSMFFSYFTQVIFIDSVVYDPNVALCPYMFSNTNLSFLQIGALVDSFVVKNLLKFQTELQNAPTSINSAIISLVVDGYHFNLDKKLMHPLVFEQVIEMESYSSFGSIQTDIFKSFKKLTSIVITEFSLKNFFHRIGIEWTSYLNQYTLVTFTDFESRNYMIPSWLSHSVYTYPNSDMCIFASFPLQKPVFPILDTNLTVCTDTIAWLTKTYPLCKQACSSQLPQQIYSICWENKTGPNATLNNAKINECLLLERSNSSNRSKQLEQYANDGDYYQVQYLFEFIVNLLAFVFIPFACIFGLVLNLRVIWAIHKNSSVELKDDFYKYMSLNSKFNCLFCLIYVLYPINYCQKYETGYFCSTIYTSIFAQVYKIVFMTYLGESIKMCSNIFYVLISINRYMLLGKEHSYLLKNISKWEMKRVVLLTVLISLLMNIGHIFQYRINYGWGPVNNDFCEQPNEGLLPCHSLKQRLVRSLYTFLFYCEFRCFLFNEHLD
jgi:hypothetical protein